MEAFGICVRGFALGTEFLSYRSSVTTADIMDLFRKILENFERFDCSSAISTMIDVFSDHLTTYFTHIRRYMYGTNIKKPPSVLFITPVLQTALENITEVGRQQVARHIIPSLSRKCTGSSWTGESGQDHSGKH